MHTFKNFGTNLVVWLGLICENAFTGCLLVPPKALPISHLKPLSWAKSCNFLFGVVVEATFPMNSILQVVMCVI